MPTIPPNSTACREMLRAIRGALAIPYPQNTVDERAYYILRSKRASLSIEAIDRIVTDPEADSADRLLSAEILTGQLSDLPPDTYRHSPLAY